MFGIRRDEGWLVPEWGAPWLEWGFGTREAICKNEPNFVKQIHGAEVIAVTGQGTLQEGDALVTQTPGVLLAIRTADCLPILMVDAQRRAVAAVHAGWRGTALEIVRGTVHEMSLLYGTNPKDLTVAMGPCIQKCCFEVGPEVVRQFSRFDAEYALATEKRHLDLQAINVRQLQEAGVGREQILRNELCTVCQPEYFWSFRREKERAGRMLSVVGIASD